MRFNHSRVQAYQTCARLYFWKFVENLAPQKEAVPLLVGRAVHAGLAAHYSGKDSVPEVHEVFEHVRAGGTWFGPELEELQKQEDYVQFLLTAYKKQWPREPWTVLAPEVEGSVPLGDHELFFRTDVIVSWKGHPWLLEHKTTSQLGPTFFRKFRMDGQISTYCYGAGKALGMRVVGAVINAMRKSKSLDSAEFARDVVMRSERQVSEYMASLQLVADRISALPTVKDAWPFSTQSCVQFNRTCDYIDLCTSDTPSVRDLFAKRPTDYVDEEVT